MRNHLDNNAGTKGGMKCRQLLSVIRIVLSWPRRRRRLDKVDVNVVLGLSRPMAIDIFPLANVRIMRVRHETDNPNNGAFPNSRTKTLCRQLISVTWEVLGSLPIRETSSERNLLGRNRLLQRLEVRERESGRWAGPAQIVLHSILHALRPRLRVA